jgi:selenide,water dikinase
MAPAVRSMRTLNERAAQVALRHGVRAATDVTGFGLLGHLGNILNGSGVGARIDFGALPLFEGVRHLAEAGVVPGGTQRNLEAAAHVIWAERVTLAGRMVCVDAQTSGGLLLAVDPANVDAVVADLKTAGTLASAIIGTITADRQLQVV